MFYLFLRHILCLFLFFKITTINIFTSIFKIKDINIFIYIIIFLNEENYICSSQHTEDTHVGVCPACPCLTCVQHEHVGVLGCPCFLGYNVLKVACSQAVFAFM